MADSNLIHCSYHKCLTVYFSRVMHSAFNRCLPWSGGYRHFNSHTADFYSQFEPFRVVSINNRALDLERLGKFRISRFLRDPRDLVVSGYFYHRRGAESWTRQAAPTDDVLPMAHPLNMTQRLRADEVTEPDERDFVQENAPSTDGGYYLVPRVIE